MMMMFSCSVFRSHAAGASFEVLCLGRWWDSLDRAQWPPGQQEAIMEDFEVQRGVSVDAHRLYLILRRDICYNYKRPRGERKKPPPPLRLNIYIYNIYIFTRYRVPSWRRCPLLATFLSVFFCLLSLFFLLLRTCSRFDLVWFRLSCDHGRIRSGSVNVR